MGNRKWIVKMGCECSIPDRKTRPTRRRLRIPSIKDSQACKALKNIQNIAQNCKIAETRIIGRTSVRMLMRVRMGNRTRIVKRDGKRNEGYRGQKP